MSQKQDVVIVGAGPTGLLLAGDLAAAGIGCTLLERRTDESNLTRAFAVHARTLEQLDARGLADALVDTGTPVRGLRLFGRIAVDLSTLPSRFPYVLVTPQYHVERLLKERATALGATIVGGAEAVGVRQDATGVDVEAHLAGGGTTTYRASYVAGTDGVRSVVRHALGLPFPGRSVVTSLMLADVRLTAAPEDVLTVNAVGDCFAFVAPFGDGWYRIFAWNRRSQLPDGAPVDFDEVREVTRRALGSDFGMHDPRWMSRFHSDERQVPRYRVGRVFLAGDAAHVHSPAGGQGMNTGLQDAANLGWKLAGVLRGWAPEDLLDSYHSERHPVGRMVLRTSGALVRLALIGPAAGRTARNLLATAALRTGPIARRAAANISGIGIAYRAPRGAHRLVGRRAADIPLTGGGRLYEALRGGRFVLVTPDPDAAREAGGSVPVEAVAAAAPGQPATLVRPDGYVAWASDQRDAAVRGVAEALGAGADITTGQPVPRWSWR